MATNKQALLRYKTIDKCLQNRLRKWTLDDLIDAVAAALYEFEGKETGIARRTIQQDIQVMRSNTLGYNAPIAVIDKKYYTYTDNNYAIANAQMNTADVQKLQDIVSLLKQFAGFGYFDDMQAMITKLENNLAQSISGKNNVVQFETNPLLKGLEFINPLFQAVNNKQVLNLVYKSFKSNAPTEDIYYPYLLKEYRNRWFLLCRSQKGKVLITLALDRIESFTLNTKEKFKPYAGLDFAVYYNNCIGVTKTEKDKVVKIIFKAHPAHTPYLITKPMHSSQLVLKQDATGTIFQICVVVNFELERELLGFGEHITILAPKYLKSKLYKRVQKMTENYL